MKTLIALLTVLLFACNASSTAVTRADFDGVVLLTPIDEVTACLGEPYSIRCCDSGEEYEYIERVSQNNILVYENHYYFRVVNGQVVSKRFKQERDPPYDLIYQADPNYPAYPQ